MPFLFAPVRCRSEERNSLGYELEKRRKEVKRILCIVCVLAVVVALATPSYGTLAFYDGFDYPVGPDPLFPDYDVAHPPDPPWTPLGGTPMLVSEPGLSYTGLASTGNKVQSNVNSFYNRMYTTDADIGTLWNTTGSFYMTYLFYRMAGETTPYVWTELNISKDALAEFSGTPKYRMYVPWRDDAYPDPPTTTTQPGLPTIFEFAGESESDSVEILPFGDGLKGIAIKFTMDTSAGVDDMCQIVVNPATFASEPNWAIDTDYTLTADVTPTSGSVDTVNIAGRNTNSFRWDEIRIADTWADAIPEPATLVVLGLSGLALLLRRRS